MKKEVLLLIIVLVTVALGSLVFIPRKQSTPVFTTQSADSVSESKNTILTQIKTAPSNEDSLLFLSRNSRLLDVTYSRLEYTPDEVNSGWYRTRHPLEIDTIIKSDTTWEIFIVGNLTGGQPMTGNIEVQGDTMYLGAWHLESQPPRMSYQKVRIRYLVRMDGLPPNLTTMPVFK